MLKKVLPSYRCHIPLYQYVSKTPSWECKKKNFFAIFERFFKFWGVRITRFILRYLGYGNAANRRLQSLSLEEKSVSQGRAELELGVETAHVAKTDKREQKKEKKRKERPQTVRQEMCQHLRGLRVSCVTMRDDSDVSS